MNQMFLIQLVQALSQDSLGVGGKLADLTTTTKTSLLSAINENQGGLNSASSNISDIQTLLGTTNTDLGTGWTYISDNSDFVSALVDIETAIANAAGVDTIAELTDTNIATPAVSQLLVYDATNGVWENADVSGDITFSYDEAGSITASIGAGKVGEAELNNVDGGVDAESFVIATGFASVVGDIAVGDTIQTAIAKNLNYIAALDAAGGIYGSGGAFNSTGVNAALDNVSGATSLLGVLDQLDAAITNVSGSAVNELNDLSDVTLASIADAQMIIYDSVSGIFQNKSISGDISISSAGVADITAGAIVNADVSASAAIDESKLALDYSTSTLNSNINTINAVGIADGNGIDFSGTIGGNDLTAALTTLTADWVVDATGTYTLKVNKTPLGDYDVANKLYVDAVATGLGIKFPVVFLIDSNLNATYDNGTSGVGATLTANSVGQISNQDGVVPQVGDRCLVNGQTNQAENGIYVVTAIGDASNPYVLTRSIEYDNTPAGEVAQGSFVFVKEGTNYASTGWVQNLFDAGQSNVIGQDDINFVQFSGAGTYSAGTGLQLNGTTFSIDSTVATYSVLASNSNGEGASLIGIEDAGSIIAATTVEDALVENRTAIDAIEDNGITSSDDSMTFTGTIGADNLDGVIKFSSSYDDAKAVKASDLASVNNGKGASIIGVEDAGGYFNYSNVEGVLSEMYLELKSQEPRYVEYTYDANNLLTQEDHYTSSDKTNQLQSIVYSYDVNNRISTIANKLYKGDVTNTLLKTATDTYTYDTAGNVVSVSRAIS